MDVIQFISLFLYRIRYRMLWGSLIVTALVIYFTQFLPFSYTVNSSIYAGVTNASAVTEESFNFFSINSTFDNIINIGKSKGTLEKVSVRLLATCLVHGDENKDTPYLLAKHYRQLIKTHRKRFLHWLTASRSAKPPKTCSNTASPTKVISYSPSSVGLQVLSSVIMH